MKWFDLARLISAGRQSGNPIQVSSQVRRIQTLALQTSILSATWPKPMGDWGGGGAQFASLALMGHYGLSQETIILPKYRRRKGPLNGKIKVLYALNSALKKICLYWCCSKLSAII